MTEADYVNLRMQRQIFTEMCDMKKQENKDVLKFVDAAVMAGARKYNTELLSAAERVEKNIKAKAEQAAKRESNN